MKKKDLLAFAMLLSCLTGFAQGFETLEFQTKSDYKAKEDQILAMSKHILTVPVSDDSQRLKALQNVIKWMSGTPDHKFALDDSIGKLIKNNDDVLGIYMASLTSFVLANPAKSGDASDVKLNAFKTMLDYCKNEKNNVKSTKELRKAIEAHDKGELSRYLNL